MLPTDTLYGVATLLPHAHRLFAVKRRPHDVDLPVLIGAVDQLHGLVRLPLPDAAEELIDAHWPGGLTLVLDRDPALDADLGVSRDTIGVRFPDADVVRAVCAQVGPIATTSANRHGEDTPATASEVAAVFGDDVAVVVDGGTCDGAPSTVVRVDAAGNRTVLRAGAVAIGPQSETQPRGTGRGRSL